VKDYPHKPVLLNEVLDLAPAGATVVIDFTIGLGGHAKAILGKLGSEARLYGFDRDMAAIDKCRERVANLPNEVHLLHGSYADFDSRLPSELRGKLDFTLLDLGLSTAQLENSGRGFSFQQDDDSLDLRFDPSEDEPVTTMIAEAETTELAKILREYGELPRSNQVAARIKAASDKGGLHTVADLRGALDPFQGRGRRSQMLAQVWQALRIWCNQELEQLTTLLPKLPEWMSPGGVIAVISFHSLEDRIVKTFFRQQENPCVCPPRFPQCVCGRKPVLQRINKRALMATSAEIEENPRSRSARLRGALKLA
jgi:16S rRNA (cytosine1402-N4)-methyltransferase